MKISLLTYGSLGDVQPFLALAVALKKAGHSPRLAAPALFSRLAGEYEIPFIPLAGDPLEISRGINAAGQAPLRMVRAIQKYVFGIAEDVAYQAWMGCQGADLILHSFLFTTGAHTLARQSGIPDISAQTFPVFAPTRAFPNVALPYVPPGWMSYFSHWLATQVFWYGGNFGYAKVRKSHPGIFSHTLSWPFRETEQCRRTPLLFGWSPNILSAPPEWGDNIHVTGYWVLENKSGYQPPVILEEFLSNGEAPVCISFGSMINRKADAIFRTIIQAIKARHQRAIILSGWSGIQDIQADEDILWLDTAPHGWLLPKCTALIHHGGAGTSGAGVRAGIASIVVPFTADQSFWGQRLWRLGVASEPIGVNKLTPGALNHALAKAGTRDIRMRAKALGKTLREEDGLGVAVDLIEQHAARFRAGKTVPQP